MSEVHDSIARNMVNDFLSGALKQNVFDTMLARSGVALEDKELILAEIGEVIESLRSLPFDNAKMSMYQAYLRSIGVSEIEVIRNRARWEEKYYNDAAVTLRDSRVELTPFPPVDFLKKE